MKWAKGTAWSRADDCWDQVQTEAKGKKGRGNEKKGFVCRPTRQEIRKQRTILDVTIASTIKRSAHMQSLTKARDFHRFCHLQGPYFK